MHPSQAPARPVTILICDTCRDRRVSPPLASAGAALRPPPPPPSATGRSGSKPPMPGQLPARLSAAIRVAGGWTYVFGG